MKTTKNDIEVLAQKMFDSYKYCFCADSTERWIKIFGAKRLETYNELAKDLDGEGFTKTYEKKVLKRFTELMTQYVEECKKQQRKRQREESLREKEEMKKHGVKRGKTK